MLKRILFEPLELLYELNKKSVEENDKNAHSDAIWLVIWQSDALGITIKLDQAVIMRTSLHHMNMTKLLICQNFKP